MKMLALLVRFRLAFHKTRDPEPGFVYRLKLKLRVGYHSHAEAIQAGFYSGLLGFATNPRAIRGAPIHAVACEAHLVHPAESLTTQQAYERYFSVPGTADLSDLEVFGVRYPLVQRQFPVSVIWKDDAGVLWVATLSANRWRRTLSIITDPPDDPWNPRCGFLRRGRP